MIVRVASYVNAFFFFWWGIRWIAQWFVMNQPPALSILVLSGTGAIVTGFFLCVAVMKNKLRSLLLEKSLFLVNAMIVAAHCITMIGSSGAPISWIVLEDMRLTFQLGTWFVVVYFLLSILQARAGQKAPPVALAPIWLILLGVLVLGYASTLMALSTGGGMVGNSGPFMVMPGTTSASLGIASSVMTMICGVLLFVASAILAMDRFRMKTHVLVWIVIIMMIAFVLQLAAALIPVVGSINNNSPAVPLPTNFLQFLAWIMVFQWYPSFYVNVIFFAMVVLTDAWTTHSSKSGPRTDVAMLQTQ